MAEAQTGYGLPLEYQSELEALQKRRQLAQMLAQQGMRGFQTQGVGPIAVRQSPFAVIAQAGLGAFGGWMGSKTDKERQTLLGRADAEGQAEMQQLMGVQDPKLRIAQGLASRRPGIRTQAQSWQKMENELAGKKADVLKDVDPQAALGALSGGLAEGYQVPKPQEPTFGTHPNDPKSPYAITYSKDGKQSITPFPRESSFRVDNTIGKDEIGAAWEITKPELKGRQERAQIAKGLFGSTQSVVEALDKGAQTGGLGDWKQSARMMADAFGFRLPNTTDTAVLKSAFLDAITDYAQKLRPASNTDIDLIRQAGNSLDTDPEALYRISARLASLSMRELQDYNAYVSNLQDGAQQPYLRNLIGAQATGYEVPDQIFGNQKFQLETLGNLSRRGGDVSRYRIRTRNAQGQPEEVPFESDTPQSRGRTQTNLKIGLAADSPPKPEARPEGMSEVEWRRLQELRGKYGTPR